MRWTAVLVVVAAWLVTPGARVADTVIDVRSRQPDALTIYASVTDRTGAFVPALSASDFVLKVDGQVRPIQSAAVDATPATLVLLLDTSGSMTMQIPRISALATGVLNRTRPGDRMKAGRVGVKAPLLPAVFSMDRNEVAAALSGPGAAGPTLLWDAVDAALDVLVKESGYRAVVILSDGQDSASRLRDSDVLRRIHRTRVIVHAIEPPWTPPRPLVKGLPAPSRSNDLRDLVRDAGGVHRRIPDVDDATAVDDIARGIHERYAITFVPRVTDGRTRSIELRTGVSDQMVRVAKKYGS